MFTASLENTTYRVQYNSDKAKIPVKASLRTASIFLAVPAIMGIGFSTAVPAMAAPQCAAGSHWETSSTGGSCAPDQNSLTSVTPAPVPSQVPSSNPEPVVTPSPSASAAPVPKATDSPSAPASKEPVVATPQPTVTVTQVVEAPSAPGFVAPPEVVGPMPEAPNPNVVANKTETKGSPYTPVPSTTSSQVAAPALDKASEDGPNKPLLISLAIGLVLLAVGIVVYSWRRFGPPIMRKH